MAGAESAPAVCRLSGDHQAQRLRELAVAASNLREEPPAAASPSNVAAGYGAKKLGGGCFSTVLVSILLWWLLGNFGMFQ